MMMDSTEEEEENVPVATGKKARAAPTAPLLGKRHRIDSSGENKSGKRGRGSSVLERWLASGGRKEK